jgi:hypothetical protein
VAAFSVAFALAGVLSILGAPAAQADLPVYQFEGGPSSSQAGGHPDFHSFIVFANRISLEFSGTAGTCFCEDVNDVITHLPAGFIGSPLATPQCSRLDLASRTCSPSTQVGWARIALGTPEAPSYYEIPTFNVEPNPDQAAVLGLMVPLAESPAYIVLSARTGGDYGLDAKIRLWGVPADPVHDAERAPIGLRFCNNSVTCFEPHVSSAELLPFLDAPTVCGEPLSFTQELFTYSHESATKIAPWPATTGCDQLTFNPSIYAQPTTKQTDSASGLDADLSVPQEFSPSAPSPSEIRSLTMTLPEGMSINPNAADGKTSCSDAAARIGFEDEAECPDFAKVGTLTLNTPALSAPIPGSIYIGEPQPGNRYRLILTANGFATHIKLLGTVEPDPHTGQLVASFHNLPQAPFSDFNLHFFGSERGLLSTPTQCGTYPVKSTFTPWDESLPVQSSTQFFNLDAGPGGAPCPPPTRPFDPSLSAGSSEATAGSHSAFSLQLTRQDGDQNLTALSVATPPGFSATLAGIPYCPDAALSAAAEAGYSGREEQETPSCPAASQIGTASTGVGAGDHPVFIPGKVYLAGPYKGAPLSLAVITPAISGPYDLGDVVVRAALHIDPATARVTAISDPLPQIRDGVLLRLRSVRINLNRPDFVLNPTNCDPFSVDALVTGDQGFVASPSAHFQVANCANLPFDPRFALRFSGSTKRTGNPALAANITYPSGSGYANIASTQVTLPDSELIDNAHLQAPCTLKQFAEKTCPPSTVIGFAKADTPLLDRPLEGPVYLRNGPHKLPDIVAALSGQIGEIDLVGRVDSINNRLRTTFGAVPDAPISHFTLSLDGGHRGLIESTEGLCVMQQRADVQMVGQNGKVIKARKKIQLPCGKKSKKHKARLPQAKRAR